MAHVAVMCLVQVFYFIVLLLFICLFYFLKILTFRLGISGHDNGYCVICAFRYQMQQSLQSTGRVISPVVFVDNLKRILNTIFMETFLHIFSMKGLRIVCH